MPALFCICFQAEIIVCGIEDVGSSDSKVVTVCVFPLLSETILATQIGLSIRTRALESLLLFKVGIFLRLTASFFMYAVKFSESVNPRGWLK